MLVEDIQQHELHFFATRLSLRRFELRFRLFVSVGVVVEGFQDFMEFFSEIYGGVDVDFHDFFIPLEEVHGILGVFLLVFGLFVGVVELQKCLVLLEQLLDAIEVKFLKCSIDSNYEDESELAGRFEVDDCFLEVVIVLHVVDCNNELLDLLVILGQVENSSLNVIF